MNYQLTLDLGSEGTRTYSAGRSEPSYSYQANQSVRDVIKSLQALIRGLEAEFGEPYDPYRSRVAELNEKVDALRTELQEVAATKAASGERAQVKA